MRSPTGFAGSVVLLAGVVVAAVGSAEFGLAPELVLHFALAAAFALLSVAVFDFSLPRWIGVAACAANAVLAAIFLLQGVADLTGWDAIARLAYERLGQTLEKGLGYVFLGWCVALLALGSQFRSLGTVALAATVVLEVYTTAGAAMGWTVSASPRLVYLLLFAWLLAESFGRRRIA